VLLVVAMAVLSSCGATNDAGTSGPTASNADAPSTSSSPSGTGSAPTTGPTTTIPLPPPFVPAPAKWKACKPDGYECASVEVPLDYTKPDSNKITLQLKRLPAGDQGNRIGSLFFNPGGPGASGIQTLTVAAKDFSDDVRARFDLVSWDPRGVGSSAPLTCDRAGLEFFQEDLSTTHPPDSADEAAKKWGESCQSENGPLLPFVGTRDVALDLETLRQAVGDEKLNFAGYSYGTLIGLVYAEMFPTHIRALVLDGVVDPTLSPRDASVTQSIAVDKALDKFIEWCPTAPDECPIAPDASQALDQLYQLAHDNPLPGKLLNKTVYLSPTLINFAVIATTYDSGSWPTLAEAVANGLQGDGDLLGQLVSSYIGSFSPSLNLAVNCIDAVPPKGEEFQSIVDETAKAAPRTGVFNANTGRPCEFWPVPAKPLPTTYRAAGSPPIMVWGTTGDNATPYENAVHVAGMLENAKLVTLDANRHAALGANECVGKIQGAYFVDLELPPDDTHC
jgi:pimeloyl-ACP methyl ester carboxylesterase